MKLEIGGVCVSLDSPKEEIGLRVDENYTFFLSSSEARFPLKLHYGNIPPSVSTGRKLFGMQRFWGLYTYRGRQFISCPDLPSPSRLLSLSSDFKSGEIYIRLPNLNGRKIFPLAHPLCELLYIILLSRGNGLLIHACGIVYKGRGFLFSGESEAGKTTMARIWNKVEGARVLNDERIIIRKADKGYRIYGTPWLGEGRFHSNHSAPLERIFFLYHSKKNTLRRVNKLDTISTLFVRSRLTHWDKAGLSFSLNFIEELSERVPVFNLGFSPDERLIDFILKS